MFQGIAHAHIAHIFRHNPALARVVAVSDSVSDRSHLGYRSHFFIVLLKELIKLNIFYTKDFWDLLLKDDWLDKFVEHGWCWNGCKTKYPIKISDFLLISLGWMNGSRSEVHSRLRTMLNDRGLKGTRIFHMPEQIAWCSCEPRFSEHQKNKKMFFDILYKLHDDRKKANEMDGIHKGSGRISQHLSA